jgi:hypothetical protein
VVFAVARADVTCGGVDDIKDRIESLALDPIECLGGSLPHTQQRLVEAWAEIHHAELLDDWRRLQSGQAPLKIEPLR